MNPASGMKLEPPFYSATLDDIDVAANLAADAFHQLASFSGRNRAGLLRRIVDNLLAEGAAIVERANLETALPVPRLQSELKRTTGQLKLFADVLDEGSWLNARIDEADRERKPIPRPDIRSMLRPLGPVAVFGASNFPLAFSVAGGDTTSALAGGNPVVVKAHPAHPGTSELAGRAIRDAVRDCGLPAGVFSLLFDSGTQVGTALVKHARVKAVGFTGSRRAGRALMDLAGSRPDPIPFFAEMSSTNPVFVLPGALRERGPDIAAGLHGSFTLGAGQFCTKPGMVFLPEDANARSFKEKLEQLVNAAGDYHLLTEGIRSSYVEEIRTRQKHPGVQSVATALNSRAESALAVCEVLFKTGPACVLRNTALDGEIFGPTTLMVDDCSREDLLAIARRLEGHLTATIHGTDEDLREYADLLAILETRVGRLVFNGFPTGVEVSHAMVHGGPYPATSDGRSTSVGSQAIFRFARPVCYQGFPQAALPEELKDSNPLGIWRMVDGQMTRDRI